MHVFVSEFFPLRSVKLQIKSNPITNSHHYSKVFLNIKKNVSSAVLKDDKKDSFPFFVVLSRSSIVQE